MIYLLIIVVTILLIVIFNDDKTVSKYYNKYLSSERIKHNLGKIVREIPQIRTEINEGNSSRNESIVDVTGSLYQISYAEKLKEHTKSIPYWQHQYIYSYSEIKGATHEQQSFYAQFKNSFFSGEYLDLKGNTNYAFILFFDLLDEFLMHKNIVKVENQLEVLGRYYPKTSFYTNRELIKRLEIIGDPTNIARLKNQDNQYQNYYQEYDNWKLGTKYRAKLNLDESDVRLLNKVWQPHNNFSAIDYCCVEIIKLFLATVTSLTKQYLQEGTTIDIQLTIIADVVARKHLNYRANSPNYKYSIDQTKDQVYSTIFKYCENIVRESYEHKRKLSIDFYGQTPLAQKEFDDRVGLKIISMKSDLISKVNPPDKETEIELNSQNTSRWKNRFDEITKNFKAENINDYIESLKHLTKLNIRTASLENIYFEASKFIAKVDKQASLILYVYYLYCDLVSSKFDNKKMTKTVQKCLFSSIEQVHEFEKIASDLINTKDLNKAIEAASQFYTPKRKRIKLSNEAIMDANKKHSGTVNLLNEYLQDGLDVEGNSIKTGEVNTEEIKIKISSDVAIRDKTSISSGLKTTNVQQELLDIFRMEGFILSFERIELFAKSKGQFKNQLIESINDTCYEILDDVLIEEEDKNYTINPDYYNRIVSL